MFTEKALEFAKIIEVKFKKIELLTEALTHRSFVNENRDEPTFHNERIEFLGDAVLELIISDHLYSTYKDRPEGELTSFRAATVRTESLATVSRDLGVGEYLRMSNGEEATGGRDKDYLLANAFEAILGAIFLDQGMKASSKFVHQYLVPKIARVVKYRLDIDSKTKFQEIAQSIYKVTPTYEVLSEKGPDHEKIFTMAVMVGDKKLGEGQGASKQKAEEQAAGEALKEVEKLKTKAVVA
jgi:ribonuclease III